MSRSNPTAKNPSKRYLQWSGGEKGGGNLNWYDKEEGKNNVMKLPFTFLVLDELNTITGFSESDHSGLWANEIRDIQNDILTVKSKSGVKARGTYDKIKDEVKAKGGKYAKSVYIAFKDETGELVIGNFKIYGAALTAWIEFNKKFDVYKCAVILSGATQAKKGATTYFVPVFDGRGVSEATQKVAEQLDQELQAYVSNYMSRKPDDAELDETVANEPTKDVEILDLDAAETEAVDEAPAKTETKTDENDVNLSDVPF